MTREGDECVNKNQCVKNLYQPPEILASLNIKDVKLRTPLSLSIP